MPFQFNIRHNIEAAADHFAEGEVRTFHERSVRVGRGEACECRLSSEEFAHEHFVVDTGHEAGRVTLKPSVGARVYLNQKEITDEADLRSGDEIRVGHWTLCFCRLYQKVELSKRSDLMSLFARAFVAAIIIGELLVVVWLP